MHLKKKFEQKLLTVPKPIISSMQHGMWPPNKTPYRRFPAQTGIESFQWQDADNWASVSLSVNSPPPAAVVDRPCAWERRHQQDAGGFHPQQQRQTPHRFFKSNVRRNMSNGFCSGKVIASFSIPLTGIHLNNPHTYWHFYLQIKIQQTAKREK